LLQVGCNQLKLMSNTKAVNRRRVVAEESPDASISLREAARRLDVNLSSVQKRIRAKTLSALPDGRLNWPTVQREWFENRNVSQVRKRQPEPAFEASDNGTYLAAKTQREYVRLKLDDLDLQRKRGELAPIGEINAWVSSMIVKARDILLRMPADLKDRMAQQADPHECERLMAQEVRRALNELAEFRPATSGA
jgi:hypothetical protein